MSPAPSSNNNNGDSRPEQAPSPSSSSWFNSWFDNQSKDVRQEIRDKLNTYEEEKKRYEDQMMRFHQNSGRLFGSMPFFPFFDGNSKSTGIDPNERHQQNEEIEDFFQRFQEEMMSSAFSPSASSTTSRRIFSSGSSVSIRESSVDGAQIDVQLPRESSIEDVSVDVLQEYPCVVQYRIEHGNKKTKSQPLQNQIRLGEYIDCAKVSASVSSARNLLSVKAPVQEQRSSKEHTIRTVPVKEDDHNN